MKDYFDLWVIAHRSMFEGDLLQQGIRATFNRRQSILPAEPPVGLTESFAHDDQKQKQWKAFLLKNALETVSLEEVVGFIAGFLMPVAQAACNDEPFTFRWRPGGPWSPSSITASRTEPS